MPPGLDTRRPTGYNAQTAEGGENNNNGEGGGGEGEKRKRGPLSKVGGTCQSRPVERVKTIQTQGKEGQGKMKERAENNGSVTTKINGEKRKDFFRKQDRKNFRCKAET